MGGNGQWRRENGTLTEGDGPPQPRPEEEEEGGEEEGRELRKEAGGMAQLKEEDEDEEDQEEGAEEDAPFHPFILPGESRAKTFRPKRRTFLMDGVGLSWCVAPCCSGLVRSCQVAPVLARQHPAPLHHPRLQHPPVGALVPAHLPHCHPVDRPLLLPHGLDGTKLSRQMPPNLYLHK